MSRFRILPYKMSSKSSRFLAQHFETKRIYPEKNFKPRQGDLILNWGCGEAPCIENSRADFRVINPMPAVVAASDKVSTLQMLTEADVPTLTFHTTRAGAEEAINEGKIIYCRTLTRSREGKGIVVAREIEELRPAKLYTEWFENDVEYRVHVFCGEVIDFVQKKMMGEERRAEFGIERKEDIDHMVRNLKKGWSFCRQDVELSEEARQISIDAVAALGLDFGAVDLAMNTETGDIKVLEINTAPGQTPGTTTHLRYTRAITEHLLNQEFSVEEYNERYDCDAETYLR